MSGSFLSKTIFRDLGYLLLTEGVQISGNRIKHLEKRKEKQDAKDSSIQDYVEIRGKCTR